jgi:imidazoleglycerol-phosphate dehydratase/histidinol-phosphatase
MKVVFLDRDGTLIVEPPDEQIDSLEKLEMLPGAIQGLRLLIDYNFQLVMVTNQDNLGSLSYPREAYEKVQSKLMRLFEGEGIPFLQVLVCPHSSKDDCNCRKPKQGLVEEFLHANKVDIKHSYVVGDRETDVQLARNIGCKSIRLYGDVTTEADIKVSSILEACRFILQNDRYAVVQRDTKETRISVSVNLDGTGVYEIVTGIGFFDHMLMQLSKHSGIDITIHVEGDLHVDEHHSIEDTGLAIGEAIRRALGDKRGIGRYGFLLPMEESLAQVALDLGGRPFCSFKAKFRREKVGDLPTELVEDFFHALADGLRANLHINVTGRNDHHKIEAVFKSVARALMQAVKRDDRNTSGLPSTKGLL